ncbi:MULTISPECIES: hypothetical protein [Caulobacter]|jgi:hypothetical protein|uniref:Uncharacterized protein n=1 Tax=Caulobacter vibrioides OR37 TaxID=1292034 RepID=R0D0X7_CAUVI|nr:MULTISPECIES: hypothetical protein [Caulobacter]ENZ82306.1 hypothetical protein OR37_01860 [Caulobacter vibrioides OR37]MBQ1562825.1 hypothetical protein [Caulobacter sp.]
MRQVLFLTVGLLALTGAWSVAAQNALWDIQARNAAHQAADAARRDQLSTQMEAVAAQERARSQVLLRDLNDQRLAGAGQPSGALTVTPPRPAEEVDRRDADLTASMDRLERLTQDALARSNARMRAIGPASQPKMR